MALHNFTFGSKFCQPQPHGGKRDACGFSDVRVQPLTVIFQVLQNFIHSFIPRSQYGRHATVRLSEPIQKRSDTFHVTKHGVSRLPMIAMQHTFRRSSRSYFFFSMDCRPAKGLCVATACTSDFLPRTASSRTRECSLSWQYRQSNSQLLPSAGLLSWLWSL